LLHLVGHLHYFTTLNPENVRQVLLLEVFIYIIGWDLSLKMFRIKEKGADVTKGEVLDLI